MPKSRISFRFSGVSPCSGETSAPGALYDLSQAVTPIV